MRTKSAGWAAVAVLGMTVVSACDGGPDSPVPSTQPTALSSNVASTLTGSPSPSPWVTESSVPDVLPSEQPDDPSPDRATGDASGSGEDVEVTVSRADVRDSALEVGGFAAGIVEEGGTCTATLEQGSATYEAVGPGALNATTTDCGAGLSIDVAGLSGLWTLTLAYESDAFAGESTPIDVELP